ncbi:hypothetical protein BGZ88_002810 [Linnemannia elongata]|nr:hypothetical protein BGZ88_002810 [Linnemannia elongata]
MSTLSFDTLPYEIQETIISRLSQHDLAACIRVSQPWMAKFNRILWRHFNEHENNHSMWLLDNNVDWSNTFLERASTDVLKRNGHLVQTLGLYCDDGDGYFEEFMDRCTPFFSQLTSAEFGGMGMEYSDERMAAFFERCSGTVGWKRLVVRMHYIAHGRVRFGQKSVEALLRHVSALEVLHVTGDTFLCKEDVRRVVELAPKLRELRVMSGVEGAMIVVERANVGGRD